MPGYPELGYLQEMPPPFQNLAASTRRDYVTIGWRKAQYGTATSEWTYLLFFNDTL